MVYNAAISHVIKSEFPQKNGPKEVSIDVAAGVVAATEVAHAVRHFRSPLSKTQLDRILGASTGRIPGVSSVF